VADRAEVTASKLVTTPIRVQPLPKDAYVVLISVDGLNSAAITQLGAKVPNLRLLRREGSSTLRARTSYEATNTLPNHTGMLTGRHIGGKTGTHVTFNVDHPGTLASLNGYYVPGVFDPVHDAGGSTAFLAEKSKFAFLIRSWNARFGARDVTGADNGRDKLDLAEIAPAARLVRDLRARIRTRPPTLTFLHIKAADDAGHGDHKHGFMGPKYLKAVQVADAEIGQVLAMIRANPKMAGHTTVIVTADHGGRGTDAQSGLGHRNPTRLDNYRVPFIVWGPGVPAGTDLYALNPSRRDPGKRRPTYQGSQPIRNLDATDLILGLLGQRPLPTTLPGGMPSLTARR
jgi:hypothetical protein